MRLSDLDWRQILNDWPEADIRYLRNICDEKLNNLPKRKILICKEEL